MTLRFRNYSVRCIKARLRFGVGATISLIAVSMACGEAILHVDCTAAKGGNGLTWPDALPHLQDALAIAADPTSGVGEIRVAQGTYTPDQGSLDRFATFTLVSGVIVRGGYAGLQGADPDAWDPGLFETVLSGDLLGNDGPSFESNEENSYTVITAIDVMEGTIIDGVTVRSGNSDYPAPNVSPPMPEFLGGGLYVLNSSLTITNCRFEHNFGKWGGAIYSRTSDLVVEDCIFQHNKAGNAGGAVRTWGAMNYTFSRCDFFDNVGVTGGGLGAAYSGEFEISACRFIGNTAEVGGAIGFNHSSDYCMTIDDCEFLDNLGTVAAGAISAPIATSDCTSVIRNSSFIGNSSDMLCGALSIGNAIIENTRFHLNRAEMTGGAICDAGNVFINCVITQNSAGSGGPSAGGGIFSHPSLPATIYNSTISHNYGSGIGTGDFIASAGSVNIANSIIWGNWPSQLSGISHSVNISFSNIQGGWGGSGSNNIDEDPLFVQAGMLDYRLAIGSPAANVGSNDLIPDGVKTDIAGNPRIIDGIVDMGAYEGEYEAQINQAQADVPNGSFTTVVPSGAPYDPLHHAAVFVINTSGTDGSFLVTEFPHSPHGELVGHSSISATLRVETNLSDGSYWMGVMIPFSLDDLQGGEPSHVDLTYFEQAIPSWALGVFNNVSNAPAHEGPIGNRIVTVGEGSFSPSLVVGNYGVHWNPALQRGIAWAAVDTAGDFSAGIRICPADVALPNDGQVDVFDLLAVLGEWEQVNSHADVNYDGIVLFQDLHLALETWGPCR